MSFPSWCFHCLQNLYFLQIDIQITIAQNQAINEDKQGQTNKKKELKEKIENVHHKLLKSLTLRIKTEATKQRPKIDTLNNRI